LENSTEENKISTISATIFSAYLLTKDLLDNTQRLTDEQKEYLSNIQKKLEDSEMLSPNFQNIVNLNNLGF